MNRVGVVTHTVQHTNPIRIVEAADCYSIINTDERPIHLTIAAGGVHLMHSHLHSNCKLTVKFRTEGDFLQAVIEENGYTKTKTLNSKDKFELSIKFLHFGRERYTNHWICLSAPV
jgi:hypothetical protein